MDSSYDFATVDCSPLNIRPEQIDVLTDSEGFQVLRNYLESNMNNRFCDDHVTAEIDQRKTWILHRDLIHAIVMPVVQLLNRAQDLAEAALCSRNPEDWELAFRGDARSAFVGLQCFMADEEDWCNTLGCPACVTENILSSDTHIRLALASIHLSGTPAPPENVTSLTLPNFSFLLPVVRAAIAKDPFWGESYWSHHSTRAANLATAIRALIAQCGELEVLVTSPLASPTSTEFTSEEDLWNSEIQTKRIRLAKRQQLLAREEEAALRRMVWQSWSVTALPKDVRDALRDETKPTSLNVNDVGVALHRRRSLTCP